MRSASSARRVVRSARAVTMCFCILARRRCGSTAAQLRFLRRHAASDARRGGDRRRLASPLVQRLAAAKLQARKARGRCGTTHRRARCALKVKSSTQASALSSVALGEPGGCSPCTSGCALEARAAVARRSLEPSVCPTRRYVARQPPYADRADDVGTAAAEPAHASHGIRACGAAWHRAARPQPRACAGARLCILVLHSVRSNNLSTRALQCALPLTPRPPLVSDTGSQPSPANTRSRRIRASTHSIWSERVLWPALPRH